MQKEAAATQSQPRLSVQPAQVQASSGEEEAEKEVAENEGASGDVVENTEEGFGQEAVMANPSAAETKPSELPQRGQSSEKPDEADLPVAAMAA